MKWDSYQAKDWAGHLYFYSKEMKWTKDFEKTTDKYVDLLNTMRFVEENKYRILDSIIDRAPGLKEYMLIHSIFDVEDNDCTDWFLSYIIDKLNIELSSIRSSAPKSLVEKMNTLGLEEIDFLKEDTILSYGLWKRDVNGRIKDPVHISCWTELQGVVVDMEPIISSYKAINLSEPF